MPSILIKQRRTVDGLIGKALDWWRALAVGKRRIVVGAGFVVMLMIAYGYVLLPAHERLKNARQYYFSTSTLNSEIKRSAPAPDTITRPEGSLAANLAKETALLGLQISSIDSADDGQLNISLEGDVEAQVKLLQWLDGRGINISTLSLETLEHNALNVRLSIPQRDN